MNLELGPYLPDLAKYSHPGCTRAENCYPRASGFGPFFGLVSTSDTFSETPLGSRQFFRNDGSVIAVVGGATKLGVRTGSGVTETTGYTTVSNEERWRFERFGDLVIAVSPTNAPQYLSDIDSDTSFSDLPGSPPTAEVVGRVGDHLVLGNISGSPSRVQWSNTNDPTGTWDTDQGDLSGSFDLDARYGDVTGIVRSAGGSGIVFQERAVWLMQFVGAPLGFRFSEISLDNGCPAPDSIVTVGSSVFYLSQDGFYVTNGSSVDRIGEDRVDRTFLSEVSGTYIGLTQGAINWDENAIVWSYVTGETPTSYSAQVIFSFALNQWSSARQSCYGTISLKQDDVTLGDLDALYANIGAIDLALGTQEWRGKSNILSAWYDNSGTATLGRFTGTALEATFEKGLLQVVPGQTTTVTGLGPIIENESQNTQTQVIVHDRIPSVDRVSTATTIGVDGFCPHKINGRYISPRMIIPAGASWDNATGVIVRARKAGRK